MFWEELPWMIGLAVGVALTAAAVNRTRPQHRPRLRRMVVMYVLYLIGIGAALAFAEIDRPSWADSSALAAQMMQALVLVSLAATIIFAIILPLVGMELPRIASDLIIGVGAIAALIVILGRRGLNATDALVSGAVVSAVLAISLQSTLGNILGGVALQLDGSIKEGDWVALDPTRFGRVRAVRWRHTVVELRDFSTVIVPNAQLLANQITILGRRDGTPAFQRLGVRFLVDVRFPPARVTRVVGDALRLAKIENVADDPPPVVACTDLGRDVSEPLIVYHVRYSIIDLATEETTSSRIRARIYTALRRDDIPLSMPAAFALAETTEEVAARRASRDVEERLAVLRKLPVFQTFTDDELRTLAASMNDADYSTGETITKQGNTANWLYVLASGAVEVRTNIDPDGPGGEPDRPVFVAQVKAPDIFGEMGLVTGEPRAADVVAIAETECFRLGKDAFEKVLLARPAIAAELSERIATRRVQILAARDGLDAEMQSKRQRSESERITQAMRSFFGL